MDRRHFLSQALVALPAARAAKAETPRLEEVTLSELAKGFAEKRFTARAVTEWYLARLAALDRKGPRVNAVIEINPDALPIAEALDRERINKGPRGPLHGVPLLLKDNIDSGDRMNT